MDSEITECHCLSTYWVRNAGVLKAIEAALDTQERQ